MALPVEDPGFFQSVLGWIVAAVGTVFGWLFNRTMKKHDDEIAEVKELAEAALPRRDWEIAREESTRERGNIRSDVKELFNKHDSLKDYINDRAEGVETKIMAQLDALRRDVNGGFSGLREEMRHMHRPVRD